ncbi:MAG TPA: DUF2243 domain-containing protein [Gemmatimonadaceae bacterium]|nr:DUF2243 domain-containing protein [Gemmatimonadaceae bacterium]
MMRRIADPTVRVSRSAGIVIGVGLGGFVDGILFHQIMHWHNMGSSVLPPGTMRALEQNMRWDGLFDAVAWLITLAGIFMLQTDASRGLAIPAARAFSGQLIMGWGIFNLVEGIVDHEILNLHHVRDLPVHIPILDWLFLLIAGLGFIALGALLMRPTPRHAPAPAL